MRETALDFNILIVDLLKFNPQNMSEPNEENVNFDSITNIMPYEQLAMNLERFLDEITALNDILPFQMKFVTLKHSKYLEELETISIKTDEVDDQGKEFTRYKIKIEDSEKFPKLHKQLNRLDIATKILPRNFIVSIVSQYDAFLGDLMRVLYKINTNIIRSSEKLILAEDLFKFKDITELKEHIVDKEIDSLLREEHYEQLKIIEKKVASVFGKEFTLTTNLSILPSFIELTQRRNLFVHTNGLASRQYIESSKKWKFEKTKTISINDELFASREYCNNAFEILYEISLKLTHVLWRKFIPEERLNADKHLNQIIYDLLLDNKYNLAITISNFATEVIKKFSSEQLRKFIVINKALAYKMLNKDQECQLIIKNEDWSIGSEFKLAKLILEDNFQDAIFIMRKIGNNDELVDKEAYKAWPLFYKFRKEEIFKQTYMEIFGEEFTLEEIQNKNKEKTESDNFEVQE